MGLTALGIWTAIYMPHAIGSSAADYGAIGVAFALLTWLWGMGIVLVCAAVYGSPQMQWRRGRPRSAAPANVPRLARRPGGGQRLGQPLLLSRSATSG